MRFFCCKQKTAYEMRISDWSSDGCSSDLSLLGQRPDRALDLFLGPVGLRPELLVEETGELVGLDRRRLAFGALDIAIGHGSALRRLLGLAFRLGRRRERLQERRILAHTADPIGRASCRAGGWRYVEIAVVAVSLQIKHEKHTSTTY